ICERRNYILGHAFCIAADINMSAIGKPGPQVPPDLAHTILDINLFVAVARPSKRQSRQKAGRLHLPELVLVEKIEVGMLMTEEQPIATFRAGCATLLQKCTECRDPRARSDHHDLH